MTRKAMRRNGFTDRQIDVIELVLKGMSNDDVALGLGLTVQGVKFHLTRIYRRLGLTGKRRARLIGLLSGPKPERPAIWVKDLPTGDV